MKRVLIAVLAVLTAGAAFAASGEITINTTEVNGRYVDDFSNLSFVNDPAVLGKWVSVDFVREPSQFVPGARRFRGDLYLENLTFLPGGKTPVPWFGWTKGVVMHLGGDHTASRYTIKEINGSLYMFFEWKSGDYIIRHQKPQYYVLKKAEPAGPGGAQAPSLERVDRN
jgi:bla regulator protein BlaR1